MNAVHAPTHAVLRRQMIHRPLPDLGRRAETGDQDDVASIHVAIDADMDAVRLEIGMLVAVGVTRLRVGAMPVLRQGGGCDTQQGGGRCGADGAVQNGYDGHDQTPL